MSNVTDFPAKRDLIAEMTGPENLGHSVIIEGRLFPNVAMFDRGDEIEFVLDHRLSFSFPRDQAWNAAAFAFDAMALGAGFTHPSGMHFTQRTFAAETVCLGEMPEF